MNFLNLLITSLVAVAAGGFIVLSNSKEKSAYTKSTGSIQYLAMEYEHYPSRHHGDYRYLKIDTYPYVFEIFEPNSLPAEHHIDELKSGDQIDIYYYETSNTHDERVNRYVQFIDSHTAPYFIRDSFQKKLGYIVAVLGTLLAIAGLVLKKRGLLKS